MRLVTVLLTAPLLTFFAACGGGDPADQALNHLETYVEAIESIDGPDDVDAAVAKIEKAQAAMKKLEGEFEGEPEMNEAQKERSVKLQSRMMDKMRELSMKPELADAMGKISAAMGE